MRILIAEDSNISRKVLETTLAKWGYDCISCTDGDQAWRRLRSEEVLPQLAILDWEMPELDGIDLCRRIRQTPDMKAIYIILLTSRDRKEDIIKGFESGVDDYLTKPFDQDELFARLKVGARIVQLQSSLAERVGDLEASLAQVKHLQGLLPICSYCKKIRNDKNYWEQVEGYISKHSQVQFSHGICPACYEQYLRADLEKLDEENPDE